MVVEVLFIMFLLILKHFVCDFWLQFDYMIKQKGTYGAEGGRHHALMHTAGTFLALAIAIPSIEVAVVMSFLDGVVHYHIDWAKMKLSRHLTPADHEYWCFIGADQMLHYLTYIGIIAILFLA
jgi:hypothetical protein